MSNPFFKNRGPILILDILNFIEIKTVSLSTNLKVNDIKDLSSANNSEITFFHLQMLLLCISKHDHVI